MNVHMRFILHCQARELCDDLLSPWWRSVQLPRFYANLADGTGRRRV